MSTIPFCPNCGNDISATDQFCSQCGQKTALHRLTLSHLLHEAIHYLTHADKSIFSLLKQLMIRPGQVASDYIYGKRKSYFPPLNFFLIVAGIFVFMLSTFHQYRDATTAQLNQKVTQIKNPVKQQKYLKIQQRAAAANRFMSKYANFVQMIATPIISLLFWLFYKRRGYNYTEHLVANLYFSGFTALMFALLFTPIMNMAGSSKVYFTCLILYFLFEFFYRTRAYYQFIGIKGYKAVGRSFIAALCTVIFWVLFSGGLISIYISTGFGFW